MFKRLYIVVATGQNVANLPPILETSDPGDHVFWLESNAASRAEWAAGAKQVLAENGLIELESVNVEEINDPSHICQVCASIARRSHGKLRPFIADNPVYNVLRPRHE